MYPIRAGLLTDDEGGTDDLVVGSNRCHQMKFAVMCETGNRREPGLGVAEFDEKEMRLTCPGERVGRGEALRLLLAQITAGAGHHEGSTVNLGELKVVLMTGEDESHTAPIEQGDQRLQHFRIVAVRGTRTVDGMVGERDPSPYQRRGEDFPEPVQVGRVLKEPVHELLGRGL